MTPAGEFPLSIGTAPAGTQGIPGPGIMSVPPQPGLSQAASRQSTQDTSATGQVQPKTQPSTSSGSSAYGPTGPDIPTGKCLCGSTG